MKKPFTRWLLFGAIIVLAIAAVSLQMTHSGERAGSNSSLLKFIAEYKKNSLADITTDGRFLLTYETNTPTRSFTTSLDGDGVKSHQSQEPDGKLRVVEFETGREARSISVEFFPLDVQFIPGTQQVFYSEPSRDARSKSIYKLWDMASGKTRTCSGGGEMGFTPAVFLDPNHVLGMIMRKGDGDLLVDLNFDTCARIGISSVDPDDQDGRTWGVPAVSPDKRLLAISLYGGRQVLIWDVNGRKVIKRITPDPIYFGDKAIFTPDGKQLIIPTSTNPLVRAGAKYQLNSYDINTYKLRRQFDLPSLPQQVAISPDGQILAVGYTEEKHTTFTAYEQARVVLYEFETGRELASAWHPSLRRQRDDPFAAWISRLIFTPDGKYLLSSTYDTLVWQIER